MTIMQHLAELRNRPVISIFAVAVGATVLLILYEPVLDFLVSPYRDLCASKTSLNCDGTLYALEDRCSHDDGPLCEGEFDCGERVAVCPRHGARFEIELPAPPNQVSLDG